MKHFKKDDTILLLIDHQVGTIEWCTNREREMIVSRTNALAKMGKH